MAGEFSHEFDKAREEHKNRGQMTTGERYRREFAKPVEEHRSRGQIAAGEFRNEVDKAREEHKNRGQMTTGEFRNEVDKAREEHKNRGQMTTGERYRREFAKPVEEHKNTGQIAAGEFILEFFKAREEHNNIGQMTTEQQRRELVQVREEVEKLKPTLAGNRSSKPSTSRAVKNDSSSDIPRLWKPMPPTKLCEVVKVPEDSDEYRRVAAKIGNDVLSVERVQNPVLYQHYQYRKRQMQKQNGTRAVEMILYHGTTIDSVNNINKHGFNRSYCGKNATKLGECVYFAVDPHYSSCGVYAKPDYKGNRYLYQARVLIGKSCKGEGGLKEPPYLEDQSGRRYDSVCSDDRSIYAVFYDGQAYPEYLITLSGNNHEGESCGDDISDGFVPSFIKVELFR